jgi:hypothetical protein
MQRSYFYLFLANEFDLSIKQDFGAGSFNLKAFFPAEAALIFAMTAIS